MTVGQCDGGTVGRCDSVTLGRGTVGRGAGDAAHGTRHTAQGTRHNYQQPVELYHYCVWFWFSMPLRKAWRCDWKNARLLDISDVYEKKRRAMDIYLQALAPCGAPWVGRLPRQFLKAFEWRRELYFRVTV